MGNVVKFSLLVPAQNAGAGDRPLPPARASHRLPEQTGIILAG